MYIPLDYYVMLKLKDALEQAKNRPILRLYNALKNFPDPSRLTAQRAVFILSQEFEIEIPEIELKALILAYDRGNETTTPEDFGGLSAKRLSLVDAAFNMIGGNKDTINLKDARSKFNVLGHPRVKSGELDSERIIREFSIMFEKNCPGGIIERIEWQFYYSVKAVSFNIDTDEFFETLMQQCWPGIKPEKKALKEPNQLVLNLNSKTKNQLARNHKLLLYLVSDSRRFRTALDFCFMRQNVPTDRHLTSVEIRKFLEEFYNIVVPKYEVVKQSKKENLNPMQLPDNEIPENVEQEFSKISLLDDETFDSIYKKLVKETERSSCLSEYEPCLREIILKELSFLEYQIAAKLTVT
ncbi:hypothetical protein HK096_005295 [Nowakowskiella sp. JEL0078]|nr:hypothetical protein HK096_005295 [Nowakowskiella sp. JEL0078]